jgi:hypothetical protein
MADTGPDPMVARERKADRAMGLELAAIELEAQIEWAEAQGREHDVARLTAQLGALFDELAALADDIARAA